MKDLFTDKISGLSKEELLKKIAVAKKQVADPELIKFQTKFLEMIKILEEQVSVIDKKENLRNWEVNEFTKPIFDLGIKSPKQLYFLVRKCKREIIVSINLDEVEELLGSIEILRNREWASSKRLIEKTCRGEALWVEKIGLIERFLSHFVISVFNPPYELGKEINGVKTLAELNLIKVLVHKVIMQLVEDNDAMQAISEMK